MAACGWRRGVCLRGLSFTSKQVHIHFTGSGVAPLGALLPFGYIGHDRDRFNLVIRLPTGSRGPVPKDFVT